MHATEMATHVMKIQNGLNAFTISSFALIYQLLCGGVYIGGDSANVKTELNSVYVLPFKTGSEWTTADGGEAAR